MFSIFSLVSQIVPDTVIAQKICSGDEKEIKKMHHSFQDRVLWKANEYVSHRQINDTFWCHQIIKNKGKKNQKTYTIKVTEDVSETYTFLIEYLIKKSCKYKGTSNASLDTYLNSVLNNKFTRSDWKKSEFGGLTIPKVIATLSKDHQTIFKSLKHKEPLELMVVKIDKSIPDTKFIIEQVKMALSSDNKLDMIDDIKESDLVNSFNDNDEEKKEYDTEDKNSTNTEELSDVLDIKFILTDCYSKLDSEERHLMRMYYDVALSIKRIYKDYFKNKDPLYSFKKIKASKENDVYLHIKKIIQKFAQILQREHYDFYQEGEFNIKKTGLVLKTYIQQMDSSDNNYWKNTIKN